MLAAFLFLHLPSLKKGAIAQLVEQRTENPCVAGSIPAGTTFKASILSRLFLFGAPLKYVCQLRVSQMIVQFNRIS